MLTVRAHAKINLVLEVMGKRSDGYHEIKSIIQAVSLFDVLSFEKSDQLEIGCNVPSLQSPDNLIVKAAEALREKTDYEGGARIRLEKIIPMDSGLGGGSSDGAAALAGLNKLWSLGLSQKELVEIAADIGSDVPFFIYSGTCRMEGRGDKITPLLDPAETWYLLVRPGIKSRPERREGCTVCWVPKSFRTAVTQTGPRSRCEGNVKSTRPRFIILSIKLLYVLTGELKMSGHGSPMWLVGISTWLVQGRLYLP